MTDLEIVLLVGLVVLVWVNHIMHIANKDLTVVAERRRYQLIEIAEGRAEIVKKNDNEYMWQLKQTGVSK